MRKFIPLFVIAVVMLAAVSGCGHGNVTSHHVETYEYTDDYGSVVNVPQNPQRIVSLSPAVTEIMFSIGADSLLVGRTEFCTYPKAALQIENIGGISNLNVEKVLSRNPDLIISGSMVPEKTVRQFAEMGVPMVCVIEKPKFDGLFQNITKIGSLVGHDAQADSLNARLKRQLTLLEKDSYNATDGHRPTVYYVVGFGTGGNFTAGGNTFINDIINMAGGKNIAEESEGWTFSIGLHPDSC